MQCFNIILSVSLILTLSVDIVVAAEKDSNHEITPPPGLWGREQMPMSMMRVQREKEKTLPMKFGRETTTKHRELPMKFGRELPMKFGRELASKRRGLPMKFGRDSETEDREITTSDKQQPRIVFGREFTTTNDDQLPMTLMARRESAENLLKRREKFVEKILSNAMRREFFDQDIVKRFLTLYWNKTRQDKFKNNNVQ